MNVSQVNLFIDVLKFMLEKTFYLSYSKLILYFCNTQWRAYHYWPFGCYIWKIYLKYIYIYIYIYIIHLFIYQLSYTYYIHIYKIYVCVYICIYTYIYMHIYIYIYILYIYIYICIFVYFYIGQSFKEVNLAGIKNFNFSCKSRKPSIDNK